MVRSLLNEKQKHAVRRHKTSTQSTITHSMYVGIFMSSEKKKSVNKKKKSAVQFLKKKKRRHTLARKNTRCYRKTSRRRARAGLPALEVLLHACTEVLSKYKHLCIQLSIGSLDPKTRRLGILTLKSNNSKIYIYYIYIYIKHVRHHKRVVVKQQRAWSCHSPLVFTYRFFLFFFSSLSIV